jgi:hypothetical protein
MANTGRANELSFGCPLGVEDQTSCPVFLSKAYRRSDAAPSPPQLLVIPRAISRSSSITGAPVRPLVKVSRPYSSIIECCQIGFPSALKHASVPAEVST